MLVWRIEEIGGIEEKRLYDYLCGASKISAVYGNKY